jgi:hypothetical protein
MAITVDVADVQEILVDGEWIRVVNVVVDFAEYVTQAGNRFARGLHLEATIQGGPHNGDVIVLPVVRVTAVRMD